MPRVIIIVASIVLASTTGAHDYKYALGLRGAMATLTGGEPDSAKFTFRAGYGAGFSYRFKDRWLLDLDLSAYKLYNDTTAGSSFRLGGDHADATSAWKATRIGVLANRFLFCPDNALNMSFGFGGGLMIWKYIDPVNESALKVQGARNETVDFSATEIFVTAAAGVEARLSRHLLMKWELRTDYLTTAGAEFGSGVNSARPRWLVGSSVGLSFSFGQVDSRQRWMSEESWESTAAQELKPVTVTSDSDRPQGVVGVHPNNRQEGVADRWGQVADSDGDGVRDSRDDCPDTDHRARGKVDIFGCPVDSDFDGISDYLDRCPFSPIGAQVDTSGCPLDSDADGVPDGLDDCPNTLYGVEVDRYGCIDLSILSKPLVLHIDYAPGSFEVDPANRETIKELARILRFIPDIKLEINGYTDNIGKPRANKLLSEKRARRVRDYLVVQNIAEDRIKVFGRGESSFVASNQTAEGRAKNRRVEITFYR